MNLAVPTIHLNGTSADSLIDAWEEAYSKLDDAFVSVKKCAPNMRDFYPNADGTRQFAIADNEHQSRLKRIAEIMDELEFLCEDVNSQKGT